jgi:hypothetical protein
MASIALFQLGPVGNLAAAGPQLIGAIGIFFLSRV